MTENLTLGLHLKMNHHELLEMYADRSRQGLPSTKEGLEKMVDRMRDIGLLNEQEAREIKFNWERTIKAFRV